MRTLQREYKFQRTIITNISSEYLNDSGSCWGTWEMLRESLQNMIDEAERMADNNGGELRDYYNMWRFSKTGYKPYSHLEFRDKGCGVDFERIFLIGESGKRGTHYRGQKGEGESLSFLVAARLGIEKWMFSKDWAITARLDNYLESTYKVLVFDLYKADKPIKGTVWRFSLTEEVDTLFKNIGDFFPELSKREIRRQETRQKQQSRERIKEYDRQQKSKERETKQKSTSSKRMIITPKGPSRLYVRGIYVKDIYSLFSYNLQNVEINRDRSMVDEWQILKEIEVAFNSEDLTMDQAVKYWQKAESGSGDAGLMEYKAELGITNSKNFMLLRNAFYKVYGKKACIFTNRVAALDAESLGFKVVDLHPFAKGTAAGLGISADRKVLGYEGDIKYVKNVSKKQADLILKLQEIGEALGFKDYPILVVEKILGVNDENLGGMYQGGTIYLMKSTIEGNRNYLLEVFIHEAGHGESEAPDATRNFTKWFERLALQTLQGQHSKASDLIVKFLKGE